MSTKKSAAACKAPTGRKPTPKQYAAKREKANLDRRIFSSPAYMSPHRWPVYGDPCWQQAWEEMRTWVILADAANRYSLALIDKAAGKYVPDQVLQQLAQAYMDALVAYNAAWLAMEACLHGVPAIRG